MADHAGAVTHETGIDLAEHERTYRRFLNLVKWGAIHVVAILILLAYFLL